MDVRYVSYTSSKTNAYLGAYSLVNIIVIFVYYLYQQMRLTFVAIKKSMNEEKKIIILIDYDYPDFQARFITTKWRFFFQLIRPSRATAGPGETFSRGPLNIFTRPIWGENF